MAFNIRLVINACPFGCKLLFGSAICMHNPLSTVTEDVDSVFEIRIACTSTNRSHNSVLMCDNLVIDSF